MMLRNLLDAEKDITHILPLAGFLLLRELRRDLKGGGRPLHLMGLSIGAAAIFKKADRATSIYFSFAREIHPFTSVYTLICIYYTLMLT